MQAERDGKRRLVVALAVRRGALDAEQDAGLRAAGPDGDLVDAERLLEPRDRAAFVDLQPDLVVAVGREVVGLGQRDVAAAVEGGELLLAVHPAGPDTGRLQGPVAAVGVGEPDRADGPV